MTSKRSIKTASCLLVALLLVSATPMIASEDSFQQESSWWSGAKGLFFGYVGLSSGSVAFGSVVKSALLLPCSVAIFASSPEGEKGAAILPAALGLGFAVLTVGLGCLSLWSLKKSYLNFKTFLKNVDRQEAIEDSQVECLGEV